MQVAAAESEQCNSIRSGKFAMNGTYHVFVDAPEAEEDHYKFPAEEGKREANATNTSFCFANEFVDKKGCDVTTYGGKEASAARFF